MTLRWPSDRHRNVRHIARTRAHGDGRNVDDVAPVGRLSSAGMLEIGRSLGPAADITGGRNRLRAFRIGDQGPGPGGRWQLDRRDRDRADNAGMALLAGEEARAGFLPSLPKSHRVSRRWGVPAIGGPASARRYARRRFRRGSWARGARFAGGATQSGLHAFHPSSQGPERAAVLRRRPNAPMRRLGGVGTPSRQMCGSPFVHQG